MKKWTALRSMLRLAALKETPPFQAEAEMDLSEKNNVDDKTEKPKRYEDVDPHGESIFALSSGPNQQDDKNADGRKVPPPLPARNPLPSNRYEDVDPHGESIFAVDPGPKGQREKDVDGRKAPPPLPPPRKYEDVNPESSGVDVVLGCGLKRAVPELPPPRTPVTGDMGKAEEVISQEDGDQNHPSLHHLNMGDHVVMWPEDGEDSYSDTYYTADDAYKDRVSCSLPDETPPNNPTETEVYNAKQSQKEKDEDFNAPKSTPRLKRESRVYGGNENLERKYEDVDPAGDSIFSLRSKPNVPSLHHLEDTG